MLCSARLALNEGHLVCRQARQRYFRRWSLKLLVLVQRSIACPTAAAGFCVGPDLTMHDGRTYPQLYGSNYYLVRVGKKRGSLCHLHAHAIITPKLLHIECINLQTDAMAAADKVLQTAELLEHIMSYLPPFELLTTTIRVCCYWKQTIDSSPAIQEKLWMRSRAASTVSPYGFKPDGHPLPLGELSSAGFLKAKPLYHGPILPNTLVFRQSGTPNVIPRITFRCTSPSQFSEHHITCKMGRPLTHIEEGPTRKRPASRKTAS